MLRVNFAYNRNTLLNTLLITIVSLSTLFIIIFLGSNSDSFQESIYFYSVLCLITSIILGIILYLEYNNFLSPSFLFYLSFCIFSCGQLYLYALRINYDYVFFNSLYMSFSSKETAISAVKYSIYCVCAMALGLSITHIGNYESRNFISFDKLKNIGTLLLIISLPCNFIYTGAQLIISLSYGYSAIRGSVGTNILDKLILFSRLSQFYIPSLLILKLTNEEKKVKVGYIDILIILEIISYILIGQRTIGLGLFLTYLIIINSYSNNKRKKGKIIISLIVMMVVSSIVAYTRSKMNYKSSELSIISYISNFIGECGWSLYPSIIINFLCENGLHFSCGLGYLASLSGLVPSFLDITGALDKLANIANGSIISSYLKFDFGVGYSLVAESFYNFGYFGALAIFFEGIVIGKILGNDSKDNLKKKPIFLQYINMIMFYELITLPRRGLYTFFNSFFYDVIVVLLLGIVKWREN